MEDLIEYAKNTYNFNVTQSQYGDREFAVKTKYFNFDTCDYDIELKKIILYAKLCDDLYEMLKLNSIYDVVPDRHLNIKTERYDIDLYPEMGSYRICVRDIQKEYNLETQFYDILTDFPEYFRSPDIKIALK